MTLPALFAFAFAIQGTARAAPAWPEVSVPPALTGGGERDAVVLIGIEDYAFLPDIVGAGANIADWQAWFLTTRGVRPVAIERRENRDAVDNGMREALKTAVKRVQRGGTLWVVYVGHGAPSDDGGEPLLVGADAQPTLDGIRTRSLRLAEVEDMVAQGAQAHTVLVLDACFSGQGVDGLDLVTEALAPARGLPEIQGKEGVTLLAATSANQFAGLLPGSARPAFSYLALGALRGWGDADRDGVVNAQEVTDYAAGALNLVVTGRRQEPRLAGDGSFELSRGTEPGPDLAGMARAATAVVVGDTSMNLGGSTDFARAAAVARAREEEARRAMEAAAQARADADAAQRAQLDAAVRAVQTSARADWAKVRPLITEEAGSETAAVVAAFVRQYQGASVSVDQVTESVEVLEVAQALSALKELQRRLESGMTDAGEAEAGRARELDAAAARSAAEQRSGELEEVSDRSSSRWSGSEATVDEDSPSARVPLLGAGAILAAAGVGMLIAGAVSEDQVVTAVSSGGRSFVEADAQQDLINVMYGGGYAGIGIGIALAGASFAVPADGIGFGVRVSGSW